MKGAQGETGMKGERGDPGLPVKSDQIFIFCNISIANRTITLRELTEFPAKRGRAAKKEAKGSRVLQESAVGKVIAEKKENKVFRA